MDKVFVYGMSVQGQNFTDRENETRRLKLNFTHGVNTIVISPRRMGKTSLVKKALHEIRDNDEILTVFMDIYDCRSEYDFYNKFAAAVIQQTSSKVDQWIDNAREFLMRLTPKLVMASDPAQEFSLALNLTPATHSPEEILNLPETIAQKRGKRVVICIDEFQQIGEMSSSLTIQKKLRGVWQHQQNCTYCLFGSKKHLMTSLFQNIKMPFYQFGEMMFLKPIPTSDWVDYIQKRFESRGKKIDQSYCLQICEFTENYSSYVQQLAWNVFAETHDTVTQRNFDDGVDALMEQCMALFQQQIASLSSYQMNMLRAIANGVHTSFSSQDVMAEYNLGSKSNVQRLQSTLIDRELVEMRDGGLYFTDPILASWFCRNS